MAAALYSVKERSSTIRSIADEDLVNASLDEERWAKEALFRRHGRPLAELVARVLGSTQDVEDVVHDAFIRAFERLDTLRKPEQFRAWLTRIAVNRARKLLRRRRLEAMLGLARGDEDALLERQAGRDASPEVRADLAIVDRELKKAPIEHRIAWILRVVEGRELTEVALICGCSLATAKRRIRATQRRIQKDVTVRGRTHG